MAFDALKHRDIAEIDRMFEWLVGLVTSLAFPVAKRAQIHRVFEPGDFCRSRRVLGVIDDRVTDVAVVANNFAAITDVVSIVTAKAT